MSLQKRICRNHTETCKTQMEAEYSRGWRHPHDIPAHILGYLGGKISSSPCTVDSKPSKSLKKSYEEEKNLFNKIAPSLCWREGTPLFNMQSQLHHRNRKASDCSVVKKCFHIPCEVAAKADCEFLETWFLADEISASSRQEPRSRSIITINPNLGKHSWKNCSSQMCITFGSDWNLT